MCKHLGAIIHLVAEFPPEPGEVEGVGGVHEHDGGNSQADRNCHAEGVHPPCGKFHECQTTLYFRCHAKY